VSSASRPYRTGSSGAPPGSGGALAAAGGHDELAEIACDPVMRRHARRVAGDLAEDALQETWYAVARVHAREPIGNLRGYFYRALVNTARRMREEVARLGTPVGDPAAVSGPRPGRVAAAASAESDALPRLAAAARRQLLRDRQAGLRPGIPACSPDPDRYRDVILAVAAAVLAAGGPASRADINEALIAAYPEWLSAPDATPAMTYQRRRRARESVRQALAAVISRDDLL
jgi:hypothetical protein